MVERVFTRNVIQPPGKLADYGGFLPFFDSMAAIQESLTNHALTPGEAGLAAGLLEHGGIVMFPGGLGIEYGHVYKNTFDTRSSLPAIRELSNRARPLGISAIVAPEHSAIIPAAMLAAQLELPIIKVKKNGSSDHRGLVAAEVDSYTGGGHDILTFDIEGIAAALPPAGPAKLAVVDEIVDTGAMTHAVHSLVTQLQERGLPVTLAASMALMEKTYTGASAEVFQSLHIPTFAGLRIEDIGISPTPWIKISGVERALSFHTPHDSHR